MTDYFKLLLESTDKELKVVDLILPLIGTKTSTATLKKEIEEHPDYPSLLSISDAFTNHKIENIAIEIIPSELGETTNPFIVQLFGNKSELPLLTVVKEVRSDKVNFYDPEKHRWIVLNRFDFIKKLTGRILLVETGGQLYERDFEKEIKEEQLSRLYIYAVFYGSIILLVVSDISNYFQQSENNLFSLIYLFLSIIGCALSILIIGLEHNQHNPFLSQICIRGKVMNCNAVIHSTYSKIGGFSWSIIGLSYFLGTVILLIFQGYLNDVLLYELSWISLMTIPYILFSIYYQWRIVKQWCTLCLSVLGVLLFQTTLVICAGWITYADLNAITVTKIIQLIFAFGGPLFVIHFISKLLKQAKVGHDYSLRFHRLKNNPIVFNALLNKQKSINGIPEQLGLSLGNPTGKYKIVKVCNPYCSPCAKAHIELEDLLEGSTDFKLQIIFNVTNQVTDFRTPPVKHFLALAEEHDEELLKHALSYWYSSNPKNYEDFAIKFQLKKEQKKQDHQIEMMRVWCEKVEIEFTPTFYISTNGDRRYFLLPAIYSPTDLRKILLYQNLEDLTFNDEKL